MSKKTTAVQTAQTEQTTQKDSFTEKLLNTETPFAIREAYNTLRTNLMFSNVNEEGCGIYVLTSAMPNDGKTVNSINLSIAFAQLGKRVLLLDGDLRNSYMHRYFSCQDKEGLSEYLAGMDAELLIRSTHEENLSVVTAGAIPPNPAELLGSERMAELLKQLRGQFDYIFIDSPPVEMVADATVLADKVDGYVFVVKSGSTDQVTVRHALGLLEQVDGKMVGFLLNNTSMKNRNYYKSYDKMYGYSYKYGYKYGYSRKRKYGYGRNYGYGYGYGYGKSSKTEKK